MRQKQLYPHMGEKETDAQNDKVNCQGHTVGKQGS